MPVDAIVGACWGDEGKGKLTDCLAGEADYVVRFQGGRNAGHSLVGDWGRLTLHMLPSGVMSPGVVNVIGPGVALDLAALERELGELTARGLPQPALLVSDRCQLVLPYHVLLDQLEEARLGPARFGSTQVGIAPFYADKALKLGVRAADLAEPERLRARIAQSLVPKNILLERLYGRPPLRADAVADELLARAAVVSDRLVDTQDLLCRALAAGRLVLVEGQLGALRDPDHGAHPYTTSSSTLASHACVGAGVPPQALRRIIAVTKAYASLVGASPFPTRLEGGQADFLRERGGEYGATTGRPRDVGWFDAVAARYGCQVQHATEVALTLLDVLGAYERIPVCIAYDVDGTRTTRFPTTDRLLRARPVYETWPGWGCDIGAARTLDDLPDQARRYVDGIESLLGLPIRWISVGPERDALIRRP